MNLLLLEATVKYIFLKATDTLAKKLLINSIPKSRDL